MKAINKSVPILALCCAMSTQVIARDVTDLVDDREWLSAYRGGTGGSSFDMKNDLPNSFDTHVSKVTVRHGERIDAVKFDWDYDSGSKSASSESYGGDGGNASSFTLSDDESIVKVKVWGTDSDWNEGRIGRISFTTSEGDVYDYGGTSKSLQQWGIFSGSQIIGLWGREGNEVDRTGIIIAPLVDLQIASIDVDADSYKSSTRASTFTSSQVLFNDTSSDQSTQVSVGYTESTGFSNSYSETSGITETLGVSVSTKGGLFGLAEVSSSLSASVSAQQSLTVGETVSTTSTTSTTTNINVNVGAYRVVVAEAVAYYGTDEVDYTMTIENTYDNEEFEVKGTFTGESTQVYGSWTEIGTIEKGVIDIYDAFEDEYGYYEN